MCLNLFYFFFLEENALVSEKSIGNLPGCVFCKIYESKLNCCVRVHIPKSEPRGWK